MESRTDRSLRGSFGHTFRRKIAAVAAYSLSLTTVVVGAFPIAPVTPAEAAPGDGVCYLIADSGGGNGGNDLLTIVDRGDFNPVTNETSIGTGTGTFNIEAMDMNPATLELFATNADQLGNIDKLTGLFTPIGSPFGVARGALGNINIDDVDGLAFNYTTNVLYGSERQSGNDLLIQIDYVTGSIVQDAFGPGIDYVSTNVGTLGHDDIDDLAFHPLTNELYGSITGGGGPGRLVKLDPLTGIATDVGPFGAGDIEGMRFDAEGFLWGTSGTTPGELFEINITTGAATNPRTVDNGGDYESTVCYVPGSDLWVDKSVDNAFPIEGSTVTYTVEVFNAGPANATGVVIEDVLPAGVTFVSASGQGTYDDASGLWSIASILRNESAAIDITVSVDTGTAGSTITNTATRIAVDQGDAVPNNDTASVDIFPDSYADLAVSKTVSDATPTEGDTITYTVTVTNNGPNPATGVTIDDSLPGGLTFVSSSPSQGTYSSASGVWTVGTIDVGLTASLGITATVDLGTAFSTITNTASVGNSDVTDPDPTNNSGSVDLVVSLAGLEIVKTSDASGPVEPGQTITYTLDITNAGTTLLDGVSVSDVAPAGTTFVPGSTVVAGFTADNYLDRFNSRSYGNSNGSVLWTTSWFEESDSGTSQSPFSGDIRIITDTGTNPDQAPYQLRIKDDDRSIRRSADLSTATYAAVNFDYRQRSFDTSFDWVIFEVASSPAGAYRELITFRGPANDTVYGNTGDLVLLPGELTATTTFRFRTSSSLGNNDILWVDDFEVRFAAAAGGTGNDAPNLVDASDGYALPPSANMQVTFQVVADTILLQDTVENTATVAATGAAPASDTVIDLVAEADLGVAKTVDNSSPNPGDTIDFTIVVANNGPSAATQVEVTDVLPSGVTYVSDNGGGSYDSGTGIWSVGTLASGGSASLVLTVTVDAGTAGTTITNTATVTQTDRPDPDPSNDTDSVDVYVPVVDLAVAKSVDTATPNVGDTVVFTVTVTNNGPDDATGVSLADVLPAGVTYVSDTASQGSYGSGSWSVGSLAASATATLTLTVTVDAGTYGTSIVNTASVEAVNETDNDPSNDSDSASIDVQHNPAIQVVKTGPASAILGEVVTYTFTLSHTAASDLSPVAIGSVVDDVAGAAVYVSGDGNGNNLLDGGETWIYTASHTVSASDPDPIVNTVIVAATDGDGENLPDITDDHSTDIEYQPLLDVIKTGPAFALVGDTVVFTFQVLHDAASDGSPVSGLTVTDDYAGAATYVVGDDGDGLLEAGESWTFTASYTITGSDPDPLVNTGTATGIDEDGDPVTDSDTHSTDVIAPAIAIEKTPDTQQVVIGDDATFTITVTNTGDVVLSDVVVGDPLVSDCDATFASLGVGAVESYTCTVTNVTADFTNVADVVADHPAGGTVGDSDTADVDVIAPAISIDKTPDSQQVVIGDDATFTITVTNTGDVALSDVVVSDPSVSDCDATFASLAVGAVEAYTCTAPSVVADFTNTAVVDADHPAGGSVTDSDTADVDVIAPAISVEKTPDLQQILVGDDATFTITVTNTGDVALSSVVVSDPLVSDCDATFATLAAGAVETYTCTALSVAADFTNTVDVTAQPPVGGLVADSDTADVDVIAPAISIEKTPDLQTILSGDDATFTITVTNTGDAPLSNVTVTDAAVPSCAGAFASLAVGAVEIYTCTAAGVGADFTNTVDVTAQPPVGGLVADSDTADVDVIAPAISIEKTPDLQTILSGDDATFTITVTNTGDAPLTDVTVTDVAAPGCDATFATLAAGAVESYACTAPSVVADFTNTAVVDADHPAGGSVSDSDTADVDVIAPAITILKSPDTQTIVTGGTATFAITVVNTGDTDLANVTVTDVAAPACGSTIGDLAAGDSVSYLCSLAGVTTDFTNTASVAGDHAAGGSVSDADTADVDVIAPAISIEKTPDLQTILSGDDATFTITVENTGDAPLTDVTVTDVAAPGCDATFATLAAGAVESYACTAPSVVADFTNTAVVDADHAAGGSVSDADTADVDVIAPAISIEKTPDLQTILSGDDATFTITVTNTGDAPLSNVVVSDVLVPDCDATFASLGVGAVESYTCTALSVVADFTNTAVVDADHPAGGSISDSDTADVDVIAPAISIEKTPDLQTILYGDDSTFTITVENTGDAPLTDVTVTDAAAPACDASFASLDVGASETYVCTALSVVADFTNTAVVDADHPAGGSVTDSDTADVDVIAPAISVEKTPDLQTILSGDDATFTITVTNTGDAPLTDVTVTDAAAPACDAVFGTLAVGASESYACTLPNVLGDLTNVADVTADHPAGGSVSDSDDADVDVIAPAISVEKTPDLQTILAGDDATFSITVTNTGDAPLTDVTVTDAAAPACDAIFASLAVGASETYVCTVSGVTADFTNTAVVDADHPAGGSVSDADTADVDVIAPSIEIEKTPDLQTILSGDDATFTITVTNTGDAPLTSVVVTDVAAPGCGAVFASLAVGAVESYTCTLPNVLVDLTNVADVTADHPAGGSVTDSDDADVDVIAPSIEIEKTPDLQTILSGDDATFTITVTNTGDAPLTDVIVTDVAAPACDATFASLAVGAVESYACTAPSVVADFTNTAVVDADHPAGGAVTDADTADVDVIAPAISIEKTPDLQQILAGDDATFTITVTNTGDAPLADVTVTDAAAPTCDAVFASLAVGAVESYTCTVTNVTADFTNVADVVADHPASGSVSDSDDADVDVIAPAISIEKTPDLQTILSGDDATFTITVTNTGDAPLTSVVVTDVVAPACDAVFASLAVGASESYTCTLPNVLGDLTNVADVTADHPAGGSVTDSDDADVDVIAPAISIEKTPDLQTILSGDDATFTITVTNTGDAPLSDIVVSDAAAPACDAVFASLGVGASESYTCTALSVVADFTNTAVVDADHPAGGSVFDSDTADVDVIAPAISIEKTPDLQTILSGDDATFTITVTNTGDAPLSNVVVNDPLVSDCDASFASLAVGAVESYTCTAPSVVADFTNVADVTADHPAGGSVFDSDTADVDVIAPAISIDKTPGLQTILSGDDATFTITVTNTGDAPLTDVTVTDAAAPACDAVFASLAVGAVESYTCTVSGVTADFINVADVTADHPAGGSVTDSDTADVDVIAPSIEIEKTPDLQTILSGDDATFTITVTNTGDAPLSSVVVSDPLVSDCDATFTSLAVGAVESYTCTALSVVADFTNTAVVDADHPAGGSVTDSDTADVDVIAPAISIEKTPDLQTILSGDDATFTITVTNTGDAPLSNVAVTDTLAPACDATIGDLAAGASTSYSCTVGGVTADFTNVADVTADHPAGGSVSDSDTADVDVIAPAISIEKTPDLQTILSGDDATFTITVTNTGDVDLSNVAVTDTLAPACDATFASLAVGAVESYVCTLPNVLGDLTNVADVTADHPAGGSVSDSDTADVDVVAPAIDIQKTPDTQQVAGGGTATFTITVTNVGDVGLSNVAVVDPIAPDCDAAIGDLAVGASTSYSCTLGGIGTDLTNVASVIGDDPTGGSVADSDVADVDVVAPGIDIEKTPDLQTVVSGGDATFTITVTNTGDVDLSNVAVTDALAPACDATIGDLAVGASTSYTCTVGGVTADFTNVAGVTGEPPVGGPVSDSDDAAVDVISPAITISKTPDSQQVLSGGDVTFTITVTNTGDVDLSNVAATDALAPACDATIGDLAAGASTSYTCTVPAVTADFTNVAAVTGEPPVGGPVSDSDDADVDVIAPAIDIEKTPDLQTVVLGGDAIFTITVTNTGDAPLTDVTVTDAAAPVCDASFATLAVGAVETYTCTVSGVAADFTNVADVTADHPVGGSVSDSDVADVDVIAPAIDIEKTPDTQQILSGSDATFTITVTNTGDVDLSNVAVTDALAPACDATIGDLAVGASTSYTCTVGGVTADFTNVAGVTGEPPVGGPVGDSDDADVDVIAPAIDIQKTPDTQQILSGSDVTFTITVANTGDVDLSNVAVTDALAPACDATIGDLAAGASTSYTCTVPAVTADFTNVAAVTGEPPVGDPVSDSDSADVDVVAPDISIEKSPATQTVVSGGDATFSITVTNSGDSDLTNVTVVDALTPSCDATIGDLAAGASTSYPCTAVGVTVDFTNVAVVSGEHPVAGLVTDSDVADVDVVVPAIDIEKTPDLQTIVSGGDATFTIVVTNTGDTDLTNVTVTDALAPDCDASIGDLAVGASTSYNCTLPAVAADLTNVAAVTGEPPVGPPVADSDAADVDVIAPSIAIDKAPDIQQIVSGGDATFTITVTNTGDADLSNVAVTDALAPACDATIGDLAVGASTSYSCTVSGVTADFTNVASVTGDHPAGGSVSDSDDADVDVIAPAINIEKTPDLQTLVSGADATFTITVTNSGDADLSNVVVTDALAPACDNTFASLAVGAVETYTCTVSGVTADFTNVADVVAQPPVGAPVTDSDDADVDVIAPAIDIEKTPDLQTLVSGADATFTITVTNSGDADLSNVVVTDALAPACDNTFASLAVGAVETYTCTLSGVTGSFTNTADVVAETPSGGTVTDSDDADVVVIGPAIEIQKTPDTQTVLPGTDVTFTITVTNTGDADLSNVAVTDPLAPNCDAVIGDLAVGASTSYDCTVSGVSASFTNVANVTGEHPAGGAVSDSDDADVMVIGPAIEIQKTPDTQTLLSGEDATFTITVTNTGDADLSNVMVTDALAPICDATIGDLTVGASTSYGCTVSGVTADFTNVADVTADHPAGGQVTDSDTADVDVVEPAIDIQKTPDTQQILPGTDATFTITVTNTGDTDLANVAVSDPLAPACNSVVGDLAVGASTSYSCTLPGVAVDMTNTAAVTGEPPVGPPVADSDTADVDVIAPAISVEKTPDLQYILSGDTATFTITVTNTGDVDLTGVAVTDAVVPACDAAIGDLAPGASTSYTCSVAGVTADFTNTADVVGTHPAGGTVGDTDTADVVVISPAIDLVKDPAIQQILSGQDAIFTITVTNIGDAPLTDVTVTDPLAPACDTVIPALGVGGSSTVTCSATGVTADFTNTATAVATHAAGGTVTDSDSADVEVLVPIVDIQKTPDLQIVATGSTATFDITVTNAGTIPLSNVAVTDALAPACDAIIGDLAVGASTTYTCSISGVAADFTNTAVVDATDAAGNPATDSDTADVDVVAPAIAISKSPDSQAVVTGGTATFTIDIANTGDIDLANVVVTDPLAPNCDAVIGDLAVGASTSYTCDLAGITADLTNTADVSGDHAAGGTVTDSDTADVTVLVPAINIEKTPDSQLVGVGGDATFTITVTNSGATDLSNVTVTDALAPVCDAVIGDLAVGASSSYSCTLSGVTADFTNMAAATGDDPLGNPVTDSDTAAVDVVDPAIDIQKSPDLQTLLSGEDALFSITVTNTGDTDLTNVVVSDPLAVGCETVFATLAIGESQTFGCTVVGVAVDFTNVASVVADTPLGDTVTASDDAIVDVITPGVDIQKTPDTQQVHTGDDVTFTITVTNDGDQDLVDLAVTDALAPACDATIAALAVGESTSYDCTASGVTADFTNIVAVSATDALGNPVSDSDDAAVDVIDPSIDVEKTPDLQTIVSGGDATFTITVTNTGDVGLSDVAVADPLAPACDSTIGDLGAGASTSYTCSLSGVTADFTNTATVVGTDPLGLDVTDTNTADVTVLVPAVDIQKTPDLQQVVAGGDATFTITVTNSGQTALSDVTVTDALAPACDAVLGDLAIGEATSYTCTVNGVSADFTNVADVVATDPLGSSVTDSDSAAVDAIAPAISIEKSPDGQTVVTGGTATFTIEVANTGDVDLSNVTVSDPLVPSCNNVIGDLVAGASTSYTCSVTDVTTDFTNVADVTATDPVGSAVSDSDTADVTVLIPGIDIQKTPDLQTVIQGTDATFTILVTNTGDTDLFGVAVSDPLAPACDNIIGDLPVGSAPVTYTCSVTADASFTNTAFVAAVDPLDNPLADEDSADVVALSQGSIAGTIAHDVAGDGSIGAGDGGFDAVDVTATWAGLDGVFGTADDEVFTTQTDDNGNYLFDNVPPGAYQVVVDTSDLPPGIDFQTLDPDSTLDSQTLVNVPVATDITGVDFAYTATGFIGDSVFIDVDGDGIQDPGEPGVNGVWVSVSWHGPDGVLGTADDLVYNTTTVGNGNYLVTGLPAGDFTVIIHSSTIPAGLSGDLDQAVALNPGQGRDDVDFPLVGSGTIGDQVFEDLDLDGVFDGGEPGVPGVTVNLTWAGGDGVLGTADDILFTTATDSGGQYLFTGLPSGDYDVAIDDTTVPSGLGSAPPISLTLDPGETDLTADFPLIGNNPPVAIDDFAITDEDTAVTIVVLADDSDPEGHDFAIDTTTDPANGTITVNSDGTITYTPNPGFTGVDTFTYTICELPGVSPSGIPATGLCDTATVTVTVNPSGSDNEGPGPEESFQSVVVGDPVSPLPVSDPDGGPVTVTLISGELPPGISWNPDGTFSGVTTEIGVYVSVYQVCDDDDPQICIEHTHTIAVTPRTLPGPGDDPDPDDPPDTLPFTGANFGELFIAALVLLISGAGLVLFSRKRSALR